MSNRGEVLQVEEAQGVEPICPHCEQPITKILCKSLSGLLGKRYVYFCSACRKVLGVSHRKGFWMG